MLGYVFVCVCVFGGQGDVWAWLDSIQSVKAHLQTTRFTAHAHAHARAHADWWRSIIETRN